MGEVVEDALLDREDLARAEQLGAGEGTGPGEVDGFERDDLVMGEELISESFEVVGAQQERLVDSGVGRDGEVDQGGDDVAAGEDPRARAR